MSVGELRTVSASALPPGRIAIPAGAQHRQISWRIALGIGFFHLVALLVFVPGFFSWTGLAIAVLGIYVFGGLGINLCYHRLLTHRSFTTPLWFEHALAVIGVCCLQDPPARWVTVHRRHHHHTDEQADPHSPLVNFFWAHMGWLMYENSELDRLAAYQRYAKDILRDPFYKMLERHFMWIALASWFAFFAGGFLAGILTGDSIEQSVKLGAFMLFWGVVIRTVLVWHITWSVNSLSHFSGYRNYSTDDDSRNNVLVAVLTTGEGWHNNHHADPGAAKMGVRWWELDGIYLFIRGLALIGLASDIVERKPALSLATTTRPATTGDFESPGG
jgi:stearoyl-CoA desaturase (delta-9 desaturase)